VPLKIHDIPLTWPLGRRMSSVPTSPGFPSRKYATVSGELRFEKFTVTTANRSSELNCTVAVPKAVEATAEAGARNAAR